MVREIGEEAIEVFLGIRVAGLEDAEGVVGAWFTGWVFGGEGDGVESSDAGWCYPAVAGGEFACCSWGEARVGGCGEINFYARAGDATEIAGGQRSR